MITQQEKDMVKVCYKKRQAVLIEKVYVYEVNKTIYS